MKNNSKQLRNLSKTFYQELASKYDCSSKYVGKIFRGEAEPKRGKGKKVKEEIEKLLNEQKEK